jgi:hypothetical protein
MPLEKAFAINAPPETIWRALTGELATADEGAVDIEYQRPYESLVLRVRLGGVPARITYTLTPRVEHTEVVATMEPEGLRYAFFKVITLGKGDTNYELLLAQGLANLKQAVEEPQPASSG